MINRIIINKEEWDEEEYYHISFEGIALDKTRHFGCFIYPTLDTEINSYEFSKYPDPRTDGY